MPFPLLLGVGVGVLAWLGYRRGASARVPASGTAPASAPRGSSVTYGPIVPEQSEDVLYLARTLWGEARGEGVRGMIAVANVIMNRVRDSRWPNTIKGVVLQPLQFSAWNSNDPNRARMLAFSFKTRDPQFLAALEVATRAVRGELGDITAGANHYYAPRAADPAWKEDMTVTAKIGGHVFLVA